MDQAVPTTSVQISTKQIGTVDVKLSGTVPVKRGDDDKKGERKRSNEGQQQDG